MLKKPKIRSEKHRRFLVTLECVMPGCKRQDLQAAHIRSGTGGGMGLKPGDDWCVPLCCGHHDVQHQIGERKFWGDYLEPAKLLAQFLHRHTDNREMCLMGINKFKGI